MRLRILLASIAVACWWGKAWAQNDAQASMYWAVPTLFNPAAAGGDSALHVTAFDRLQWVGIDDAPQTFFVSADMPFRWRQRRFGAGAALVSDQAGLFQTVQVGLQGSWSLPLWGGRMALGVQLGMVNQTFRGGDVYVPDGEAWEPGDDAIPTADAAAMAFDAALGVWYERGWWWGGIGIQHVPGEKVNIDEYAYTQIERSYYFHAGGNIPLRRTLFLVQPSVLVKSMLWTTQTDWTLRLTYDGRFWGGLTYRPGDALVIMLGADVGSVRVGYAYDVGLSPLASAAGGSHELLATYTLHIDLDNKKRHPHKSIRIL